MKSPKISIIIPCFNAASYIAAAIESLLAQNYAFLEIIVVDDGSTDDSRKVIQAFGDTVIYHYQSNQGMWAARNVGIRRATGDWIGFLDADDSYYPNTIAAYLVAMTEHPEIGLFWSRLRVIYEAGAVKINKLLKDDEPIHIQQFGTFLCERSTLEQIGYLEPHLHGAEDIDWLKRAIDKQIPIQKIEHVSVRYRRHNSNYSQKMSDMKQLLTVFKNTIDRQRRKS